MTDLGIRLIGAVFAFSFIVSMLRIVVRPTPRLASRLRPYTAMARSAFGRTPDSAALRSYEGLNTQSVPERLFRPLAESLANRLSLVFGSLFDDRALALKLRHAGLLLNISEQQRVYEYRVRQIGSALLYGFVTGVLATLARFTPAVVICVALIGVFVGITRKSSRVSHRIEERCERMRIELYTINQLLAIYLRTSGSPVLAAQRLAIRGRGEIIEELNEALRLHARGMPAAQAFERIAELTPEPFAARTYKLLASGAERGADLASGLLALSSDVRDARRTDVKRLATKQQAAMLVPIIFILAPIMLLFIGMPLPSFLLVSN